MERRFAYACAGGFLSAGAPLGLLAVRFARHRRDGGSMSLRGAIREVSTDPPDYLYVGTSTALAFSLFGYILGRQADRLAELSETDPLTGLSNARGLFDRLDAELGRSRRYREPLALLSVDLDGLKSINDRYGHRAGDDAICSVADVIRSELRESDVGARWGGDEFAVLAPEYLGDRGVGASRADSRPGSPTEHTVALECVGGRRHARSKNGWRRL